MAPGEHDGGAMPRRDFLKKSVVTAGAISAGGAGAASNEALAARGDAPSWGEKAATSPVGAVSSRGRKFNSPYTGEHLNHVAFPLGGMGAGMICLEGTGALSHVSLHNRPEIFNEPLTFAAVCIKGEPNKARVLEGPVPKWKAFGRRDTGNGAGGKSWGLPRYRDVSCDIRFPFSVIELSDPDMPLSVRLTGWSPFAPNDADGASLPVAGLEYTFINKGNKPVEAVFSFNSRNLVAIGNQRNEVKRGHDGLLFQQVPPDDKPWEAGAFHASVDAAEYKINAAWFRGGWFDPLTIAWKDVADGACHEREGVGMESPAPGGTLFAPITVPAGKEMTVALRLCWYSGQSDKRFGKDVEGAPAPGTYQPWYSGRFKDIGEVAAYWRDNYAKLRAASKKFSDCFHDMTLPPEVIEAVAANLTILKSPTVLRQSDGRMWCYEGCSDDKGCCHGSCTHVWNYAQALPHLFPALERTLRETEFEVSQDDKGHQAFRTSLPIRPQIHDFHAAADGQLGGIMKVHREWRIGGDKAWLGKLWPKVKASLDYCIEAWDPRHKGVTEEPHHNTYDIEFWGPDGMCTSFYLGALAAAVNMGKALGEDVSGYESLLKKGLEQMHSTLYDGEYFIQKIQWEGLRADNPVKVSGYHNNYSPEALELLKKEGPKYQYGTGCLSDGVLGEWMAMVCGVGTVLDQKKVASHLNAIHRHNFKKDLSDHVNPQRPAYAIGGEAGLLLCSWPKGGALSLPFVYSNEVWTGIEYQVAAHLMLLGMVEQGLEIVRGVRDRYDGVIRNPLNEYECGHWYARAMASYALLQGLSGARYDAVDKVLHLDPRLKGDFRCFISTATGYGTVGVKGGQPFLDVVEGRIEVREIKHAREA